jgi:hypothetical protein
LPLGYRVGRKHVTQEVHDKEVARLLAAGLTMGAIAERWKVNRRTIERAAERLGAAGDQAKEAGGKAREYITLDLGEYEKLPDLQQWIDGMKVRAVSKRKQTQRISFIKRICESLGIYPAQLDIHHALKWLAAQDKTQSQLRQWKGALRSFLTGTGQATGEVLTSKGIDSKHHNDKQYATVDMSEDQIFQADGYLANVHDKRARALFRLGVECACRQQEFLELKKEDFFEIDGIPAVRTYAQKTGSFWTKYPTRETVELWKSLEVKGQGGRIFTKLELGNGIRQNLKAAYEFAGATNPYFTMHSLHCLRHVAAQRLLRKTGWNRAVTAKLGGWEAEKTLEDHYGAVPEEVIRKAGSSLWVLTSTAGVVHK